jgi:hypothetical protein
MSSTAKDILCLLFIIALAMGVSFFAALRFRYKGPETVVETRVDTLYLHDTIRVTQPVPVTVRVRDTIRIPVTVPGKTDTVWAQLPREEKVYQDSTYRAVVSGVFPQLDTIDIYRKNTVITVTNTVKVPPPRWSIGVQAGYGATRDGLSPYIGIGVSYRLLPLN